MRILVLSPLLPMVGGSGGQTREYQLLRRLAALDHQVVVCCPVPPAQRDATDAARAAGLEIRPAHRPSSRVREVLVAMRRRPALVPQAAARPLASWQLEVLWEGMRRSVEMELSAGRPGVVLVIWDVAAAWRSHLPASVPAVISLHDVSWEYMQSRADAATGATRARLRLEAHRLRAFTRRWLPRYDAVIGVSDEEASRLRTLVPGLRADVVPNGVDLDAFAPTREPSGPPTVLFTGTMNYAPNAEGGEWLATQVWPRVRARHPEAHLAIVGRDPGRRLRELDGKDGITVLGAVADMAPYFEQACLVAVPILSGGGTRLKVLEAAGAGRPIVSTARGAEGLDLRDGTELVIADGPGRFADAVSDLLGDRERRLRLGRAARATVEARYGWRGLGDRLSAVLEGVAARTATTSSNGATSSTSAASTT